MRRSEAGGDLRSSSRFKVQSDAILEVPAIYRSAPCSPDKPLLNVLGPVFEDALEFEHELAGVCTVDEAVIEAEGEVLRGADGDGVVAVCVGEDDGLFIEGADREDGRLGLVDDGGGELVAEDAGIGEGEGGTDDFVGQEFLRAGAEGEVGDGEGEGGERAPVGVADDGNDKAPVERDGDAEMDGLVVADGEAGGAV